MTENINKTQVLWLIREYLSNLEAKKAANYVDKYFPEINDLDKKNIKKLKKLPSLHEIVENFCNSSQENTTLAEDQLKHSKQKRKKESLLKEETTQNTTDQITKINANKKSKKVKHTDTVQDVSTAEEIDSNSDNLQGYTAELPPPPSNTPNESTQASIQNRFKRIDEDKYKDKLSDNRLSDNSYWNMKKYSNKNDDFASKAALELGQVRGKGFRQEKAKKKRCSWKGNGTISTGISSIQFSDSD